MYIEAAQQAALSPAGQITAVEISPTTVNVGDTLDVKITVKNTSDQPLQTQGPDPGYTYVQGQTYIGQQFASEPGTWRVGIDTHGLESTVSPYGGASAVTWRPVPRRP